MALNSVRITFSDPAQQSRRIADVQSLMAPTKEFAYWTFKYQLRDDRQKCLFIADREVFSIVIEGEEELELVDDQG